MAANNVQFQVWQAQQALLRCQTDKCIEIASNILATTPGHKQAWFLKLRALTVQGYIPDTDLEEECLADLLLDTNENGRKT